MSDKPVVLVADKPPALVADKPQPVVESQLQVRQGQLLAALSTEDVEYADYLARLEPKKQQRLTVSLNRMKHGLQAVAPLTCQGPSRCPFVAHCPIPTVLEKTSGEYGSLDEYPMMMPCVLESMYQRQKIIEYVQHLDVDPNNPIEMAIVNELAIIDLYKNRAMMVMSEGDRDGNGRDFIQRDANYAEVGDGHELIHTTSLHPAFDVVDRLERRRTKLVEQLIETRAAKANLALKQGNTGETSNILKDIAQIRRFLEHASTQATGLVVDDRAIMVDD